MERKDVVVVGSGPNELVAACYLARAGRKVIVVEGRARFGGVAALEDVIPGFRVEPCPPGSGWVSPRIAKDLGLAAHGLELEWADATVFAPRIGEPSLCLWRDMARSRESIAQHSSADAQKWDAFSTRMARLAGFLETLYGHEPPRIMSGEMGDLFTLLGMGLRLRRLGKVDMIELLRTLPMSVQDLLDDWFESELLKAAIGAGAIANIQQGPRSAGTCFVLLHHLVGRPLGGFRARTIVRNERGHLVDVLVRAAEKLGVELRSSAPVARIQVVDGRATAVVLESGEEIAARVVLSGADPRRTFFDLVDPVELEPEFARAVKNVKLRGVRAVVNLALDGLPAFAPAPPEGALSGVISIGPDLVYLERAYDDAKHGGISRSPVLEATIPSLADPSLAPPGKHVMSVAVQYSPYRLRRDGAQWDDATRDALADRVVALLSEYAPNLGGLVLGRKVWTPPDLERDFGLGEGHVHGGEATLDQILFMRPIPGCAHYRTPIAGLFLGGDSTHPGGALPGLAGANAAREIGKDG
jgi:phytoene dehydrogenase-like protein